LTNLGGVNLLEGWSASVPVHRGSLVLQQHCFICRSADASTQHKGELYTYHCFHHHHFRLSGGHFLATGADLPGGQAPACSSDEVAWLVDWIHRCYRALFIAGFPLVDSRRITIRRVGALRCFILCDILSTSKSTGLGGQSSSRIFASTYGRDGG